MERYVTLIPGHFSDRESDAGPDKEGIFQILSLLRISADLRAQNGLCVDPDTQRQGIGTKLLVKNNTSVLRKLP